MRQKILKRYAGFVPAYIAHPLTLCAYYHCVNNRTDGRYCEAHAGMYLEEALKQKEGASVLTFPLAGSDSDI